MENQKCIQIAILGAGTVGGGIYQLLQMRKDELPSLCGSEIQIKKILVRNKKKSRPGIPAEILTENWEEIREDPEISVVIELMGGMEPALTYITEALNAGKHVVTANKDLIAEHGHELQDIAEKNHRDLRFEASVCGAIPIIQALKTSLSGNRITEIMGIVNGTTNFILSRMSAEGMDYQDALDLATKLGYAEADPTADVDGLDAGRKIAIMASIAFHTRVFFHDVYTEGIRRITAKDISYAREFGYVIKLVGLARQMDDGVEVKVHPMLIPADHPLSSVSDSFNAVFVRGDALGDAMFYGRGAGSLPTASAVMGDLMTIARHGVESRSGLHGCTFYKTLPVKNVEDTTTRYFLRLQVTDRPGVLASLASVFGNNNVSLAQIVQHSSKDQTAELVIITDTVIERNFRDAMAILRGLSVVKEVSSLIRVYDNNGAAS